MKVLVVGPGAFGLMLTAKLGFAGADVSLFDYRADRALRLERNGFDFEDADRSAHLFPSVLHARSDSSFAADAVLLCVKAYSTADALKSIGRFVSDKTLFITFQNGLGPFEDLADIAGAHRSLAAVSTAGAALTAESSVRMAGAGITHVGPSGCSLSGRICDLLRNAGFDVCTAADITPLIWEKVIINAGINPVSALHGITNGELPENDSAWSDVLSAASEAAEVARACGIKLSFDDPSARLRQVCEGTSANRSSMLQDIEAGRRTEIDYINGAIVSRAAVPVPVNSRLVSQIKELERRRASCNQLKENE